MKKIYLAGFEVFRADCVSYGEKLKQLCKSYGFIGLYPLDNVAQTAEEIFNGNISLIDECDILAANLNPFRGHEPDSGTCFEIGYAYAKGKAVYAYLDDTRSLVQKLGTVDNDGYRVEDFSMPINLMLGVSDTVIKGNFEDCLKFISGTEKQKG